MKPPLVTDPDLITPEWLTDVLRHDGAIADSCRVTGFESEAIGTGQVGTNVRYSLEYEGSGGPPSLVCKFSSRDPESAATGVKTLTYETEVAFYRDLADSVDISRPHCFYAGVERGTANIVLVLEDLSPAKQGDQIAGCTVEQATLAIDEAAKLHGPRWGDPSLADLEWLDRPISSDLLAMLPALWDGFVARYESALAPVAITEGQRLFSSAGGFWAYEAPVATLIHQDFRLDNMLFDAGDEGRPITVVDWQTVRLGLGPHDVAYFLGNAFDPEVRRTCEKALVRRYHERLRGYGVSGYTFDRCWEDYRRSSYASLAMAVLASMMVGRTDRGDEMFMAMANRSAQMAADLEASSLFESGGRRRAGRQ